MRRAAVEGLSYYRSLIGLRALVQALDDTSPDVRLAAIRAVPGVTGAEPRRFPGVVDAIAAAGVRLTPFAVAGEPTTEAAEVGVGVARAAGCDLVIGLGGGSALDAGKAIAALMTNPRAPLDYLEVVGRGLPLSADPAPFIAVPTTAGTGSEVTRNAVLAVKERRVKVSLRSRGDLDVAALAQQLAPRGGGHRQAAGATIEGGLKTVMATVVAAVEAALSTSPSR